MIHARLPNPENEVAALCLLERYMKTNSMHLIHIVADSANRNCKKSEEHTWLADYSYLARRFTRVTQTPIMFLKDTR